jgi:hypothetical protein
MKPDDFADEEAGELVRHFLQLDEVAVVVRTKGDDVRIIAPDYDKLYMARMLRIAASMLEDRADQLLN